MATQTTNYNLIKPALTDNYNVEVNNSNMDIIDAELYKKVDKIAGKGLSTNDYTTTEKNKLGGIASNANNYSHPGSGTNPHGTTKSDVGLSSVTNDKQMPISGGILENYREKLVALSGTTTAINLLNGNTFTHTLSGNTIYSISNAVSGQAHSFTLIITQGSTVRTVTFPASVAWAGGEIPDLTVASKTYILTFLSVDGGTTWRGMSGGEF